MRLLPAGSYYTHTPTIPKTGILVIQSHTPIKFNIYATFNKVLYMKIGVDVFEIGDV